MRTRCARSISACARRWAKAQKVHYVLEPKVDGVSASLRYEAGKLMLVATRGNGVEGDDITAQVRTIQSIPLRLADGKSIPAIFEVRGEIYMVNEVFQAINKQKQAAGEEPYKNPRNLTAGTLKQLDPKITAARKLRFVCHGLGQVEPLPVDSYYELTQRMAEWGLPISDQTQRVDRSTR